MFGSERRSIFRPCGAVVFALMLLYPVLPPSFHVRLLLPGNRMKRYHRRQPHPLVRFQQASNARFEAFAAVMASTRLGLRNRAT